MKDESKETTNKGLTESELNASENLNSPSAVEEITSRIEMGKQYGGADVLKMMKDALSADGRPQKDRADKAEAEVKRLTGDLATVTTSVTTLTGQMTELTKAQNEAELAKYSDDKPQQDSIRVRQAQAAEAIRLGGIEAQQKRMAEELKTGQEALGKATTSVTIKLAAQEAGVDEAELAELVPDGNPSRLKKMADILKRSGTTARQSLRGSRPAGLGGRPVSTVSVGGGGLGDLSPDEKIQRGLNQQK